ncbi:MAG: AbrB/MazE/SpoVT family DNA-binding domain-containing protein [Nanoarchaeota archaeon]
MKVQTVLRKWGNSIGVVIPKKVIEKERLREGEEVFVIIESKNDLKEVFGSLKDWKIDSQKLKDELRKGWK